MAAGKLGTQPAEQRRKTAKQPPAATHLEQQPVRCLDADQRRKTHRQSRHLLQAPGLE